MIRIGMLVLPWLMMHADDLIAWLKRRYAVKRCGGMQGRAIECDEEA